MEAGKGSAVYPAAKREAQEGDRPSSLKGELVQRCALRLMIKRKPVSQESFPIASGRSTLRQAHYEYEIAPSQYRNRFWTAACYRTGITCGTVYGERGIHRASGPYGRTARACPPIDVLPLAQEPRRHPPGGHATRTGSGPRQIRRRPERVAQIESVDEKESHRAACWKGFHKSTHRGRYRGHARILQCLYVSQFGLRGERFSQTEIQSEGRSLQPRKIQ